MRHVVRSNDRSRVVSAAALCLGLIAPSRGIAQSTPAPAASQPTPPVPAADPPGNSQGHFSAAALITEAETGNQLPRTAMVDAPTGETREQRARRESEGYVREVIADADTSAISDSWQYYRTLGRSMATAWTPPRAQPPGALASIRNNLFINPARMAEITQRSVGGGVAYAIGESMNYAHPNSPMPLRGHTATAIAAVTAVVTQVEIEVDQNERGEVLAVRVVHSSRDSDFDRSAMQSVRAAVEDAPRVPMPGGWRSRWSFEQAVSRDPLFLMNGGMPGDSPTPTMYFEAEFDEVTGQSEVHTPGRVHVHRRVRLLQSHEIRGSAPVPHATTTGTPNAQ